MNSSRHDDRLFHISRALTHSPDWANVAATTTPLFKANCFSRPIKLQFVTRDAIGLLFRDSLADCDVHLRGAFGRVAHTTAVDAGMHLA